MSRDYYLRLAVVVCIALASAAIVGAVALLPAYIQARNLESEQLSAVAKLDNSGDKAGVSMETELKADMATISRVESSFSNASASRAISDIISLRGNIRLTSFSFAASGKAVSLIVQGIAPTRDDLVSFKNDIENSLNGAKVDLPLSELTKSADIPFAISVAYNQP
ncbi:MAG: hypothetical protein KGJ90_03535 [Patescibacteria group bacterium]|nr:hypothetical protein [Patescibacteria group bacterium]